MRHKPNFILQSVAGLNVVVPVRSDTADFNGMLTFNETGAFLWSLLDEERTEAELTEALLEAFEVERDVAASDVSRFLEKLHSHGLLTD